MSDDLDQRIAKSLPGIPGDMIFNARQQWYPENIIRRILTVEIERKIATVHNSFESCKPDELLKLQGQIKGLQDGIATINSLHLKS